LFYFFFEEQKRPFIITSIWLRSISAATPTFAATGHFRFGINKAHSMDGELDGVQKSEGAASNINS
jgi:hypothetical protein